MKIIAIDDEQAALNRIQKIVNQCIEAVDLKTFLDPEEALLYLKQEQFYPDIAFLDIEMFGLNGLALAKLVKDFSPKTNIIFVTAYSQYAIEAYKMHAHGYLLKPVTVEQMQEELTYLPTSLLSSHRIQIRTFGNFDIFVDGKQLQFKRSKAKEILAYLVDRQGCSVSKKEIASILWEDKVYERHDQIYLQTIISEMVHALKDVKAEHILIKHHNNYAIDPSQFTCDYYNFLNWDHNAINSYQGEYMTNYSWAEFTTSYLSDKKKTVTN